MLNRCLAPTSKAAIGDWFQEAALRRLLDVQASQLTSQRFWDNKRQARLRGLQMQLRRRRQGKVTGGKAPTVTSVRKKVDAWLKARHMKDLFRITITEDQGLPCLTWQFDKHAWQNLQRTLLGKTLLFTDNDDWSDADIVVVALARLTSSARRARSSGRGIRWRAVRRRVRTLRVRIIACISAR